MPKALWIFCFALCLLPGQQKTVLAVGAHAGDMEVSCGAALARAARMGARVVLLHLTLGENGHPRKSAAEYGRQKREEAFAAAMALNAEVKFGKWQDGQLRDSEETEQFVAQVIQEVKATQVITNWRMSIHPDHSAAHEIARKAVLRAAIQGWRGVNSIWFAENWEDAEEFKPYVYVDVTSDMEAWRKAANAYEFLRGGVSAFPYMQYYEGQSMVRGAEARKKHAVAFEVDTLSKKRVMESWP